MAKGDTVLTRGQSSEIDEDMDKDEILHMRLQGDLKRALDDLRRVEPDIPTRSEMVRRLIQRALEAMNKRKGK